MKPFELEIITPENTIFKGKIFSLIIPAYEGYMGIMAGHSSFIGSLGSGKISFNIVENTSSLKNEKELSSKTNQDAVVHSPTSPSEVAEGLRRTGRTMASDDDIVSEKRFDDSTSTYFVKDGFIEVISQPFSMTKATILCHEVTHLLRSV